MDFRKTFDKIPENFDKYRPRYCDELFEELIIRCKLNSNKKVLEIGPGTGQATEPVLKTGCDYTAIELGENFTDFMRKRFEAYSNFNIINADFEKHIFENNVYDFVYSAATIQWIPEQIAFSKIYDMLKPGAYLAMFLYRDDYYNKDTEIKGVAEIIIAKQRNGPIGTVKMAWIPEQTRFANLLDKKKQPGF